MTCHSVSNIKTPHCIPWIWDNVSFTLSCSSEYFGIGYRKEEITFLKRNACPRNKTELLSLNIWGSFRQEELQALPISSNHAGLWNTAHLVWLLTNISSSKMNKTRETVMGEMLIPGLGTGLPPRREWLQKMALQKQISFSGNQQDNRGPSSLSSKEHHSGRPILTAPTFLNPQLHTRIYYFPRKFIFCGSLQLLCYSV